MPPAFRNHLAPTACGTPVPTAASSLDIPAAIETQNRRRSSRPATGGRPGDRNGARPDRSERRFPVFIAIPHTKVLRRPLESTADFLKRSPSTATAEDIRRFQIRQSECGMNAPAMNSTVAALRFFFNHTADRPDLARKLIRLRYPRKLPVVLSPDEAARLIAATTCLKHRAALSVAYGAGLRVAEVAALKFGDIESERMMIRVERGKGGRYRHAMLSPSLLELLRAWWREGRQQGVMRPGGWLFPGQDPATSISTRQLSRVVEAAASAAGLTKHVSLHTLRHSFATHLLEDGVDILFQKVSSKAVAQRVRRHALLDPGHFGCLVDGTVELACRQWLDGIATREQPAVRQHDGSPFALPPPEPQQVEQLR